ncbi:hypothetical protein V8G54_003632 [Vigna mungo]|uniref:Uncharacterized protein n=1 Tax=Vigna mungo TaxID=3915 RepID=A0AAQ3PEA3_VIGMU
MVALIHLLVVLDAFPALAVVFVLRVAHHGRHLRVNSKEPSLRRFLILACRVLIPLGIGASSLRRCDVVLLLLLFFQVHLLHHRLPQPHPRVNKPIRNLLPNSKRAGVTKPY